MHKVYKHLDGALGGTEEVQESRAVGVISHKRPAPMIKRAKGREEEDQPHTGVGMKKKLVFKPVVLDFDFGYEGVVPASSTGSRQAGALKWVRCQSPFGEGPPTDAFVAEVSLPALVEVVPPPALGRGPAFNLGAVTIGGSEPLPRDFPQVNPFAPDALPLLFNREKDKRQIEKVVSVANDMGFNNLKALVSIFPFPVLFFISLLILIRYSLFVILSVICQDVESN